MSRRRKIKGEDITQVEQIKRKIQLEKKRKRQRRLKIILRRVFTLFLMVVLVVLLFLFDQSSYSRIKSVTIEGNNVVSNEVIEKHVGLKENDRLTKAFMRRLTFRSRLDGVANIKLNMYYTKGLVNVEVEEYPVLAMLSGKEKGYLMSDNMVVNSNQNIKGSIPILKNFSKKTFEDYPEFSDKLAKVSESSYRSISEIEIVKEPLEEIFFKITMNNGYYVFTNIRNLLLLDYYPDIVSGIQQGDKKDNRCIYFLDYGHTDDNQSAVAKPCK